MFGLEGSGFIVAIAVTLLLAGAIVYYCNTRITAMEKAIVKQNQVLADFIGNVKLTLTNIPPPISGGAQQPVPVTNGATQEAVDAAADYYSNTTPDNKIDVSDDSQSEDDSEEESDSDLDSDSDDNEEDDDSNESKVVELGETIEMPESINLKVIGLQLTPPTGPPPPSMDDIIDNGPEITEVNDIEEIIDEDSNIKTIKLGDIKDEEELEQATLASSTLSSINSGSGSDESDTNHDDDGETVNSQALANVTVELVNKMKVADLRGLAVKLDLGNEDAVKKIKKNALQDMIKQKINETDE